MLILAVLAAPVAGQVTSRVSVGPGGAQANGFSGYGGLSVSADGRFVAFSSAATNLVAGDTNGTGDVFVRDRRTGTTDRVSLGPGGVQGNDGSGNPSISADGRFVAFTSAATNLVAGDTNGQWDVFVRDRLTGTTERVSVDSNGAQGNAVSDLASISADGRYVAFSSIASNLVGGDTNGAPDVFVRDRLAGATERVSVDSSGVQGNNQSGYYGPSISADGRYVAFDSTASNLVSGDTNLTWDVFVRDRFAGTTERVSVDSNGAQANSGSDLPSISADGRYVAFTSFATNLVGGDTNGASDIFVHDRQSGRTTRVSLDSAGAQGNGDSDNSRISADGRFVAFTGAASNLVGGDTNGVGDVFLHDRLSRTTERLSLDSGGRQGNGDSGSSSRISISGDGRYAAFQSLATDLVPVDTNGVPDVFVRDRLGGPSFTSLCDPGTGGVVACPCANPPGGAGHGCDNSANTGGAVLSAAGGTSVSSDSLFFATSGELPAATSIVLQGDAFVPSGVVYGQGVRCVGGPTKRLYTKLASGGAITAPDFAAGDPTVTARSAALGSVILPGQSRWYVVFYRDPTVVGGCPAWSTFNSTQTGRIDWVP